MTLLLPAPTTDRPPELRCDGWWFVYDSDQIGPYDTKKAAQIDYRGLKKFDQFNDRPGWAVTDTKARP